LKEVHYLLGPQVPQIHQEEGILKQTTLLPTSLAMHLGVDLTVITAEGQVIPGINVTSYIDILLVQLLTIPDLLIMIHNIKIKYTTTRTQVIGTTRVRV